ncbi:MAG: hypothetical protein JWM25_1560 [Thermoleophilia bacterium]|nr:hypothetical protein [Thermoleophilia bacterium]MCZ4496975.1 hypothetical protein [Thermoleophilia bacterium]
MTAAYPTPRPPLGALVAFDAAVRPRSPRLVGLACACTLGISGAVRIGRLNGELARFGAARGAMPFPFITVNPAISVLAWLAGGLGWILQVSNIAIYLEALTDGLEPAAADITNFTASLLLLAPLWLTALHTARRIRTAQHLAGAPEQLGSPFRVALLTCLFPPAGLARLQGELNRAWDPWRAP